MAIELPKFEYVHPVDGATVLEFDLPPEGDPIRERVRARERTQPSATGIEQTQFFFFESNFELRMIFITEAKLNEIRKFFYDFAGQGGEFEYFPDKTDTESFTCSLRSKDLRPTRVRSDGAGGFEYDVRFQLRSLDRFPVV